MEKIKRDKNRVNISKILPTDLAGDALTGGYIIKIDKPAGRLIFYKKTISGKFWANTSGLMHSLEEAIQQKSAT
jgi:hypothetical protein